MNLRGRWQGNPLNTLYDEVQMPDKIRRSLNFIILGNIFGSARQYVHGCDRYQALFILSCVLRIAGVFLFVPRFVPDNEARPKDLVRHMFRSLAGPLAINK